MAGTSKTARQAMNAGMMIREKKVISDEEYVKNLRYDVENGIHATQEGAKALLREYDKALATINEMNVAAANETELRLTVERALQAALEENEKLKAEFAEAQSTLRTVKNDLSRIQFPDTTGQ